MLILTEGLEGCWPGAVGRRQKEVMGDTLTSFCCSCEIQGVVLMERVIVGDTGEGFPAN